MTQTSQSVDPVFAGIAKALYGDVDPRELLEKFSPGGSDLHIDKPLDPKKQAEREKKLALTGMGATTVATAGGLHALSATRNENLHRMANAGSEKAKTKLVANEAKAADKTAARTARVAGMKGPAGKVLRAVAANPKRAAIAAGTGWAGLHAVELAGDALGMRANANSYNAARRKQQGVSKAFRLKPLNAVAPKVPSLRARRPAANPLPKTPAAQGALYKPVRKSGAVVLVAKAGKHRLDPLDPPGPVTFSNSASGMGQGNLVGARATPPAGAPTGSTPKLKPVAGPIPAATPPPKQSVPPPRAATPDPPPQVKTPPVGAKAPKIAEKIGAGVKGVIKAPGLKPLGLIAGAAGAGAGVSSFLHRDKVDKGFVGNVRRTVANAEQASGHASSAAKDAAEATAKINGMIPQPRTIRRAALGAAAAGSFGVGGAYGAGRASGRKQERRKQGRRPALVPFRTNEVTKSVTFTGEIAKVDADKRQVFGWASVSAIGGQPVVDLQGDIVPIDEIEKSAYRYVVESRKGGDMHRRVPETRVAKADQPLHTSDLIESFVVTGEKLEKMGLPPDSLPHGWWVGFSVNDEDQWQMVKSGERKGFSIHGKGIRTPADVSKSLADMKDTVSDAKDKAGKKLRAVKGSLKTRTDQALHPPNVKLKPVKSSAVSEMGYQPQTRRLSYQLRSNPGAQYTYKVPVTEGVSALSAESKGRHYATKVARKAKRSDSVSPAGRARLFVKPDVSKGLVNGGPPRSGLPGDNRDAQQARTRRTAGLSTAGVGYLLASRSGDVAPGAADLIHHSLKVIRRGKNKPDAARTPTVTGRQVRPHKPSGAMRTEARIKRVSGKTGAALVGLGLLGAAEGTVSDLRNRGSFGRTHKEVKRKVNEKLNKSAFGVNDERPPEVALGKAFDPERQRHRRADLGSGALAGSTVVAGAGSATLARQASRSKKAAKFEESEAAKNRSHAATRLSQMQTKPGAPGHVPLSGQRVGEVTTKLKLADMHGATATKLARSSRKLGRGAIGTALGAGALGASAVGLHRSDRKGSGRSYGY